MANAPVCALRGTSGDPPQQYSLWGMPSGTAYATEYSNPGPADPRQVYNLHPFACAFDMQAAAECVVHPQHRAGRLSRLAARDPHARRVVGRPVVLLRALRTAIPVSTTASTSLRHAL